jgi:DNA-binding Xre family transcriptional regulator
MPLKMTYRWQLRERMAEHGWWKTTDLAPLLAQRGIALSPAQIYRLVTHTPERLSLDVLAALCDIFACTPSDLIAVEPAAKTTRRTGTDNVGDVTKIRGGIRPRRACVIDP